MVLLGVWIAERNLDLGGAANGRRASSEDGEAQIRVRIQ
jgi:hypothetical protein